MSKNPETKLNKNPDYQKSNSEHRSGFLPGTLFGTILGIGSTLVYQYLSGILQQPRLTSKAVLTDLTDFDSEETRALFIATESLLAGIEDRHINNQEHKQILHAGYRNFRESWARDFGFAAYGLLALEEYLPVKETLEAFYWHQKSDGQFPVKLRSMNVVRRFFHSVLGREQPLDAHLSPKYITGHRTSSFDGQALLVIAACNYIHKSGDSLFAQDHWIDLVAAIRWLQSHTHIHSHLIEQAPYADWADSVAREGAVSYTNIVYWKALEEMAGLAEFLDHTGDVEFYQQMAADLKSDIFEHLWNPQMGYFVTSPTMDNLSSAGNLLAIAWGLTDRTQSNLILTQLEAFDMATPVPTQAAHPSYSISDISIENRLGRLPNYHTEGAWLWIGAWHIIAHCQMNQLNSAQELLSRLAQVIVRDQQIYEVYGLDGQPLSSIFYTSEAPLTWNAGMLVYAYHILEQNLQKTN